MRLRQPVGGHHAVGVFQILGLEAVSRHVFENLPPKAQAIAGLNGLGGHARVVDERAVGAVEIKQRVTVVGGTHDRMTPRDRVVAQFEIALGVAADQQLAVTQLDDLPHPVRRANADQARRAFMRLGARPVIGE